MQIEKTASFTGHRPGRLDGYDKNSPLNSEVRAFLRSAIERLKNEGYEYFISGGALGVDQWAADIVLEMGLKLVIALPFATYGENWLKPSQDELSAQKEKAFKVHVVCEGPYAPWKNHERNKWMAENSSVVVAVWDWQGDGGTANAVRGAIELSRRIIRYNPLTKHEEPV